MSAAITIYSIFLCINLLRALQQPTDLTARRLSSGRISGAHVITSRNTSGYVFLGIPYAQPPLGDLRYRAPQRVKPWKGVIPVKEYKNSCLWNSTITSNLPEFTRMSEDCLTVNVFTNAKCLREGGCAVLYMIHGGQYNFDSPMLFHVDFLIDNFTPEDRSVVVVTVTYRLGSFGFLNLSPNLKSSAIKNVGLLDMIEGLRWVQREIANLGGDPNRVTILGHSSGADNAHQLTVSPLTEGLFDQAIIMSGLLGTPLPPNNGHQVSRRFAVATGCAEEPFDATNVKSVERVLNCMRMLDGKRLVSIQRLIEEEGFTFQGPCIDGPGGVLPSPVENLLITTRPIRMMIGTVEKEMQFTDFLLCNDRTVDEQGVNDVCAAVTALFGYQDVERAGMVCTWEYSQPSKTPYILDDAGFFVNGALYSEALIRAGGTVYLYQFDYAHVGDAFDLGPYIPKYTPEQTPHHTEEFVYIVGIHLGNFTKKDEIIRVKFSQLLVDFINKGDPSSFKQRWNQFNPKLLNYFSIDFDDQNNMRGMKYAYHSHAINFWNDTMLRIGGGKESIMDESAIRSDALRDVVGIPSENSTGSGACQNVPQDSSVPKRLTVSSRAYNREFDTLLQSTENPSLTSQERAERISTVLWSAVLVASLLVMVLSVTFALFKTNTRRRNDYEIID